MKHSRKNTDSSDNSSSSTSHTEAKRLKRVSLPSVDNIVTGSSGFAEVVESSAFVDKTMLIKDIVNSRDKVLLITCPRRFGKSTNMNMLKIFLEIEVNAEGKEKKDETNTKNYQLFTEGYDGKKLEIAADENFIKKHLNAHPVIFVDFLNAKGGSYDQIVHGVKTALHNAFMEHENLYKALLKEEINEYNEINGTNYPTEGKNIKVLTKIITSKNIHLSGDLSKFKRFYDNDGQGATEEDVKTGLKFLSGLLHKYSGKKVYVLIDEYDAPVHCATQLNLKIDKVNILIDGILCSVFKGNDEHLERGLMTGISGMVRSSASSGLNNVREYKFLQNNKFAKHYGFTSDEVSELLDDFKIEEQRREEVKNWYDGYLTENQDLKIYNPYSVVQHIKDNQLKSYWEKSGAISHILEIFKVNGIREKIEQLIQGQPLKLELKTDLTIDGLKTLQAILNCKDKIPEQHIDLFFSYLFELGYLSFTKNENHYKIPNYEIKLEFIKNIVDYYIDTYTLRRDDLNRAIEQLDLLIQDTETDDITEFKQSLDKLFEPITLANIANTKQSGIHPNEDLFHSIVNVIAIQSKSWKFGTEIWIQRKKSKDQRGRIDIILVSDKARLGMIIELKHAESADKALEQAKEYQPIFEKFTHIEKIKYIGINVTEDKKVDITCENNTNYSPSGSGINVKKETYNLSYHNLFNKYYNEGIAKILRLRIQGLPIDNKGKILILSDIKYQFTTKILKDLTLLDLKNEDILLLPYNIDNTHWVGLMITRNNNGLQINYVDPENRAVPEKLSLILQSEASKLGIKINISQLIFEQQKYNNCGPEVIENFILLLTGSRLTQEEAVPFHSKLIENDLLVSNDLDNVEASLYIAKGQKNI